ncbi:MAG: ribonuclease HII [Deltaproteobacteria bacterium]|nr:ribonuclease HII [Deltaproteobacteria bacterium]
MDVAGRSLSELRARAAEEFAAAEQEEFLAALRRDPRRGARELAERLERRRNAAAAEVERLEGLFARRARLFAEGVRCVAGVDEVGMGPLAGPVVAVAVILREHVDLTGLKDSKQMTRGAREKLALRIRDQAIACSAGKVQPAEIVAPQTAIVGGDATDGSIAAASVVAKVHRDAIMRHLAERYPGYGFEQHMGYGTESHLAALQRLGPSPVHRRSFSPVARAERR